ncbi:ATP-binding protein [Actinoallomurus sp. CA-150999]|uniref:ATP-binding protein n=1 Tax=Actinoallomurus sp. CA-150999 TaxID=3239887 RepID=UPI003D9474BF
MTDGSAPSWISLRVHDASVAIARRFARDVIADHVTDADHAHSIVLVVSELVTNALRAASRLRSWSHYDRPVQIGVLSTDQGVHLYVTDPDPRPISVAHAAEASALRENGRGLGIVDAIAGQRWTTYGDDSKTIHVLIPHPV